MSKLRFRISMSPGDVAVWGLLLLTPWLLLSACGATFGRSPGTPTTVLPDPLSAGWQGQPVCERLHENVELRVLRCTFPPGAGHERHFHAPHFGYALSGGRVRIVDAEGVREVEPPTGSSYWSEGVAWHEILNIGETTIVYLIIEPSPHDS